MDGGDLPVSEVSIASAIVIAVGTVPGVADVSPGPFAEAATYGPGERVRGVAVGWAAGALDIHVRLSVRYADSLVLPDLADHVRSAVRQSVDHLGVGLPRRIDVTFDDLRIEE